MKRLLILAVVVVASAALALAQEPKSQEELDAVLAVQNAPDPNARIEAANKLLVDYEDTEFKEFANYLLMVSYQQLDDFENMLIYGERTLEINPSNPGVMLQLAYAIPSRTREFDLDKEEKLAKAEDYAKRALTLVPNLPKVDPSLPDEEWLALKKEYMAQANESLGLVEFKRESYDESASYFEKSINLAPSPNPMTFYHLAETLLGAGRHAEALEAIDNSIAAGGVPLGGGSDAAQDMKKKIEDAAK